MGCIQSPKANVTQEANKSDSAAYHWTKLMDSAQWKKTYNYQLMAMGDTLWLLHPDGFWFSMDGKAWQRSAMDDIVGNQAFLDYVVLREQFMVWVPLKATLKKHLYHSCTQDYRFQKWERVADKSELPSRFFTTLLFSG